MELYAMKDNILNISTREEWRNWLEAYFDKETEAWLVYARKSSGAPRIVYNDAVEEALCFGWIDSINKTIDNQFTMQRFTPRNPRSKFSQPNIERLKWLAENHLIYPTVLPKVQEVIEQEFVFPEDILNAIKCDEKAWNYYAQLSEAYKRIRIAYIDSARKRPAEFAKRLSNFIQKTHDEKMIAGFGGIEKYY